MEQFFVMHSGEDGISVNGPFDSETLRKRLNEDYWGAHGFHDRVPEIDRGYFMEKEGQEKLLIIRGVIVVPQPRQVVTTWELPSDRAREDG